RLDVVHPAPLVVAMDVPLTVVVGSAEFYRLVTRTLLRAGVASDRALPVWWRGPLSGLDAATLARTGVLVVGASDLGEQARAAEIVALGGNLLFHADYTRSLAERSFLVAYFVSGGEDPPARELSGSFRDPEHRVMTLDGPAIVLIKESWTPAWRAQLRSGDQERSLAVLEA